MLSPFCSIISHRRCTWSPSRADPPLPIVRLRGRGQLTELRLTDLRFTHDEAAAFLNQVMGLDLPTDDVAALASRTEGWIAGLQMAAACHGSGKPVAVGAMARRP
jgi:ATP/maltotriose-dependent transcriptional regulator MalT